MAIDIIARAAAASAQAAADATSAASGPASPAGLFSDLPLQTIDAAVKAIVTAGYATAGAGGATYVSDSLATAALATAHPRFCKASANGRHFRLLPDANGLIPVACGGAVGFAGEPGPGDALVDERAILAAAEDYKHAIGAAGVRLDARRYAVRRITLPGGTSYWDATTYCPIHVRSSTKWVSTHPEGTTLYRRKANGQQCDATDYETATGYVASLRGGFFFIHGINAYGTDPDPGASVYSFTLDSVRLDGGIRLSMGTTFEVLDKPVWQQNDSFVGNVTLTGKAGVIGFASELLYLGQPHDIEKRTLYLGPEVVLGETSGSCINANGINLQVHGALCYNAYLGIEGWTGPEGVLDCTFRDITHGAGVQGGTWHAGGFYYEPTRSVAGYLPMGRLNVRLQNCARFDVGAWLTGEIVAVDSVVNIAHADVFGSGAECIRLNVTSICDQHDNAAGVAFWGPGTELVRDVYVRLDCLRTKNAVTNGYKHLAAVTTYGSLGPDCCVELGAKDGIAGVVGNPGTPTDWGLTIKGYSFAETYGALGYFDCEANNGGTVPNHPVVALSCSGTASGVKNLNLPTAKLNIGTRIYVMNATKNFISPGLDVKINGSNFRSGTDEHFAADYSVICVEYSGNNYWRVVERL